LLGLVEDLLRASLGTSGQWLLSLWEQLLCRGRLLDARELAGGCSDASLLNGTLLVYASNLLHVCLVLGHVKLELSLPDLLVSFTNLDPPLLQLNLLLALSDLLGTCHGSQQDLDWVRLLWDVDYGH
jgi:hypothetical protein